MPLQPAQRELIVSFLGVRPRSRNSASIPGGETSTTGFSGRDGEETQNWFTDKVGTLVEKVAATVTGGDPGAKDRKAALLDRMAKLVDPVGASADELKAFAAQRQAAMEALQDDEPVATEIAIAGRALANLSDAIGAMRRAKGVKELKAANPAAAAKAEAVFGSFASVLGGTPVTPESLQKVLDDRTAQRKLLGEALSRWNTAMALPPGKAADTAVKKAAGEYLAVKAKIDQLDSIEDAMIGQQSLTEALNNGKLSAQSDAKFDPVVAEKLIAAFGKSARMASAALDSASSAKFPGAIADAVGPMIDRAKAGFQVTGKGKWAQSYAEDYGGSLLKQAGQHGPEFLAGLPSYLDAGAQFSKGAAGATGATFNEAMANRSRKLAGALIKPDGSIDVTSPGSAEAVGHLLYHPDVMQNPTPGLSDNVLQSLKMLKDPVTGPQASTILKGVTAPTNAAGLALVRTSLAGGPTGAVDAGGTQVAVLMAMLQPFTQGAVGSCFSTGPLRRQRETDPLATMKSYAKLASTGTFQPGVGAELPAVTNLPPGENPLMRSLEYTVASAGARLADSNRRALLGSDIAQGTDLLKGAATKGLTKDADKVWRTKQQKLAKDVADALTFTYDPTVISGPSRDGSSSKGRYMVVYQSASISTKDEFQTAMLEVAIASLGITAGSDAAAEVELVVKSDAFATMVCPRAGQAPWQLSSGGASRNTLEVLKGSKATETTVIAAAKDPRSTEGERTKAVLAGLLNQFRGSTAQMATIDTVGQHTFNILPNDPSLAVLKGANDTETQQKMQTALIDKGLAMKDKILVAERAAWLFDKAIEAEAGSVTDPALKMMVEQGIRIHRPTVDMKPAAVTAAVMAALDAFADKLAETDTAEWKGKQVLAGKTVSATQEAAEKLKLKAERQEAAGVAAKTATMADLDAPQFVIADTNWGSSTNTVEFVIAPDPDTGEPIMWKRTEPPGSLSPAGRDWVDRSWNAFD